MPSDTLEPNDTRFRLTTVMAAIAVIIFALIWLHYHQQAQAYAEGINRELSVVANLQAKEVEHWRSERLGDAKFYQNNPGFLTLAKTQLEQGAGTSSEEFEASIAQTQANHHYEILLINPAGETILFDPAGIPPVTTEEWAAVRTLTAADEPRWLDFYRLDKTDTIRLALLIPLRDPAQPTHLMGVMIWRLDPVLKLYPALQDWPTASQSAELTLVRRNGDNVEYVAPLRLDPAAALNRTVTLTEVSRPSVQAALGHTGVVEGLNYRGDRIFVAIAQVKDSPWALLARMDRQEALAPVLRLRLNSVILTIALLLTTLSFALFIWRRSESIRLRQIQTVVEQLRESEERLQTLLETSPTIIYRLRWDATAPKPLYISSNIQRILGYSQLEALQPNWWIEHLHPEERVDMASYLSGLQTEGHISCEYRFLAKAGHTVLIHDNIRLIRDDSGNPLEIIGCLTDITAENDRLEELRLKSAALEAAANAIVITNTGGAIVWANAAFTRLTGYELGEVIHRNPREVVKSGVQSEDFYRNLWETILAGRTWTGELVNRRKDGSHYTEEMTISPVQDTPGQITHYIAIKQDVTEKKLLQEQFLKAQRLESLGMLAAGIAHDLNNMLAPIIFSGPLLRRSLTAEKDLRIVSMLESSAERGAALVKQVVAFAQGGTNTLRITQLKHVARDVVALAQSSFPKSIQIHSNIATDAWPVMANPTQIHQVLLNLCVNARDAMPDGGTLTVSMSNRRLTIDEVATMPEARPGNWLIVEVSDTGTGIPPEVLNRMFEAFFTTKALGKGSGLGLTTVRTIVQVHGGFISVKSAVGQGTTMRVFLPASNDPAIEANPAHTGLTQGNGELILLVDDDHTVRESVEAVLIQGGYRVIACADGVEAIVLYQSKTRQVDLVITDVDMPNLNGAVLAATLRQLKPDLRIIAISGLSSATHSALPEARKHVRALLHKPFGAQELLRAVHEALQP